MLSSLSQHSLESSTKSASGDFSRPNGVITFMAAQRMTEVGDSSSSESSSIPALRLQCHRPGLRRRGQLHDRTLPARSERQTPQARRAGRLARLLLLPQVLPCGAERDRVHELRSLVPRGVRLPGHRDVPRATPAGGVHLAVSVVYGVRVPSAPGAVRCGRLTPNTVCCCLLFATACLC